MRIFDVDMILADSVKMKELNSSKQRCKTMGLISPGRNNNTLIAD